MAKAILKWLLRISWSIRVMTSMSITSAASFCYSNFQQAYILPDDVVKEEISASVNNGILSVKLPKMTKEHIDKIQRNIDIK